MNDVPLTGCTPEPLMNYLKALGVFRLVAEQADPDARLSWQSGSACLYTALSPEEFAAFFLERYEPTPITAPWNGGSGFYGGGSAPLDAIADSGSERLAKYRDTISRIRQFIPREKPKDDDKVALLMKCRSELSDDVVPWLDVCFVLGESAPSYFPLLGTGGNDGRLDFTNNFMQRLRDVIAFNGEMATEVSKALFQAAVFEGTVVSLGKSAVGQFNPGGIGGANGTQGKFEAGSLVNPWDFVLMIEGALVFAGSVARRMGVSTTLRAAFPFSVESVAVGYASAVASEETSDGSRAEMWLPLWSDSCSLPEVKRLFAEGRAQLGRRQAKNAVEFALAVNLLGVSRGINSFVRYGFLKRNGLAFLAAPLGRVLTTARPQARILEDPPLANWIEKLRRACGDKNKTPNRYQTALRSIDRAVFAFANRSEHANDSKYLVDVLRAVGAAERVLASGLKFAQEKYIRPLSELTGHWLDQADSPEFRLAASLAGIQATKKQEVGPLRVFLEEVEVTKFVNWSPGSSSAVWSNQPLATNLAAAFRRRQMEAFREGFAGVPLKSSYHARLDDVIAFLHRETDDDKLHDLLWGLIAVEYADNRNLPAHSDLGVPFEFGVPRLLVDENSFVPAGSSWNRSDVEGNAHSDRAVFDSLASGGTDAVSQCVTLAARRLKSRGLLVNGYRNRSRAGQVLAVASAFDPERLLAAMLFPLARRDLEVIANSVLNPPEAEE